MTRKVTGFIGMGKPKKVDERENVDKKNESNGNAGEEKAAEEYTTMAEGADGILHHPIRHSGPEKQPCLRLCKRKLPLSLSQTAPTKGTGSGNGKLGQVVGVNISILVNE